MAGQYQRAPESDEYAPEPEGLTPEEQAATEAYLAEQERRYKEAKKRVKELKDFYTHLGVYAIINLFIFLLDAMDGGLEWFYWPLFGWGIGVAVHAFSVFAEQGLFGYNWEERKIREYMGEKPKRR